MSKIYWQAHRGGAYEVPQNTVAAALYGWSLGAIVEVDVRTTSDGEVITLHNGTLEETADVPDEVGKTDVRMLTYEEILKYEVNRGFENAYPGEKVPKLSTLFELMREDESKQLYLDLKDVDLEKLALLIKSHGVADQCVFCHCDVENCRDMKRHVEIRCMLWIGGSPEEIMNKFHDAIENDLDALDQIQLHLNQGESPCLQNWSYELSSQYLRDALFVAEQSGLDLELFPWKINERDILRMLNSGFTWFCTDYPLQFKEILNKWEKDGD